MWNGSLKGWLLLSDKGVRQGMVSMIRDLSIGIFLLDVFASGAFGATVRLSVVASAAPDQQAFTAEPGILVEYEIRATVEPDDPNAPDTNGLAGFTVDLITDFGVTQPQISGFGETVSLFLTMAQQLGTPAGDDLIGIAAAQLPGASAVTGIGVGVEIVLAHGFLMLPAVEGVVTVELGTDSNVTVLDTATSPSTFSPNVILDPGFTITIVASTGGTGGTGGTGDGTGTGTDGTSGTGTDNGTVGGDGTDTTGGGGTTPDTGNGAGTGNGTTAPTPIEQLIQLFLFLFGPIGVILGALIALFLNVSSGTIP